MSGNTQDGSQGPSQKIFLTPGQVYVQRIHDRALRRVDELRAGKSLNLKGYRYDSEYKIWAGANGELEQALKFGKIKMSDLPQSVQNEMSQSEATFGAGVAAAATGTMSDESMARFASVIAAAVAEAIKPPKDDD